MPGPYYTAARQLLGNRPDQGRFAHVVPHQTIDLAARIVGTGDGLLAEDVASASYSIYEITQGESRTRRRVAGHQAVALTVADTVVDGDVTLNWTLDDVGYNVRFAIPNGTLSPFAKADARYQVTLTHSTTFRGLLTSCCAWAASMTRAITRSLKAGFVACCNN